MEHTTDLKTETGPITQRERESVRDKSKTFQQNKSCTKRKGIGSSDGGLPLALLHFIIFILLLQGRGVWSLESWKKDIQQTFISNL